MMRTINLTINYEVERKEKFQQYLDKFQKENQLSFDIQRLSRYEKIRQQYQAHILVELSSDTNPELVFQSLQLANKFKTSSDATISVIGPVENEDGFDFQVILNQNTPNNPVKWLHIQTD